MGDTGRQLPDRRQLLGAGNLPALLLQLLHHGSNPRRHQFHLGGKLMMVAHRQHPHGSDFSLQLVVCVPDQQAQLRERATHPPSNSHATDQPGERAEDAQQYHRPAGLRGQFVVFPGHFGHGLAI